MLAATTMTDRNATLCVATLLCCVLAGCGPQRRPVSQPAATRPAGQTYTLNDYLPGQYPIHRHYVRTDPQDRSAKPVAYPRLDAADRRVEGIASPDKFRPLKNYYPRLWGQSGKELPYAPFGKGGGGFLEFDPPLGEFPEHLQVGQSVDARTRVKQYWANGLPAADGTLTRTVTLEAVEPAATKAGQFDRCLRLRIDMELDLGLVLHFSSREYLWLAPGIGEVRRTLHLWGWSVLAIVDQRLEYDLVRLDQTPTTAPSPARRRLPCWKRVAVLVSWKGLRPYPSGLVVESTVHPPNAPNPARPVKIPKKPPC